MAVIGQEVLHADNLTTVQKEGKKCTHIFISGNYIVSNTIIKYIYKVSLNNNDIKIMIKSKQTALNKSI